MCCWSAAFLKCVPMQLQEAIWCCLQRGTHIDIPLLQIPVGKDFRLSGKAVKRAITSNTILVVASSPGFPHGVMDHVQDIAQVSAEHWGHGGHHAVGHWLRSHYVASLC